MKAYQIGQEIKLKSGFTGKVIEVLHGGHGDIRPPYNRKGQPVLKGTNGHLGHLYIIPNEWEALYGGEIKESEII